jgi:hypothetical protein
MITFRRVCWALLAVVALLAPSGDCNHYDPHVPQGSLFFEGYYSRFTSIEGPTFGLIVGNYLRGHGRLGHPAAYLALLVQDAHSNKLQKYELYPNNGQVVWKVDGVKGTPKHNPADGGNNTSWSIEVETENGHVSQWW